jgi:predicted restriction endonuclease
VLDRGAISISENRELLISPKLNGTRINEYFHNYTQGNIFTPRNTAYQLNEENLIYHRKFPF